MKKYSIISLMIALLLAASSCTVQDVTGESGTSADTDTVVETQSEVSETEPSATVKQTKPEQTEAETDRFEYEPIEIKRDITADYAALLDVEAGKILFNKGGLETKIYPASTTKLITALTALENCPSDTVFTAGDEVNLIGEGSSIAYIKRGHMLTLDMLIAAMLLPSGNDAAYVVAAGVGRILANDDDMSARAAVDRFCEEMNAFAQKNGMTGSHFTCPDGYHDDDHYTTLHDMLIVGSLAVQNETILKYTSTVSLDVTYASGEINSWSNTNALINPASPYYYSLAIGLKTGTTSEAGKCLISAAQKDGRTLIACVFHASDDNSRFGDSLALLKQVLGGR